MFTIPALSSHHLVASGVALCLAAVFLPSGAVAQDLTVLVSPTGEDSALTGRVERVLRSRLDQLGVAGDLESSPLAWRDLELATGCVGEDAACYSLVASELRATTLILSNVECTEADCVLEVVRWRGDGLERRLVHEEGLDAHLAILDGIDPALREIYGLPPAPIPLADARTGRPRSTEDRIVGPVVGGAVALALAGGALAFAALGDASRSAFLAGSTATVAQVDVTVGARERAEREIVTADVLFAAAGAVAITALVWLVVELTGGDEAASPASDARRPLAGVTF